MNTKNSIKQHNVYDNCIDYLRLIAAIIVLLSHSFRSFDYEKTVWLMWLTDGATGVAMLFGISGFLIFMSYDRGYNQPKRLLSFYIKRIFRIYPALITMYLGVAVLDCINGENIFTLGSLYTLFRAILYPTASIYAVGIYNGVLCTLGYELTFYLLVPILYKIYRNKSHAFWIISIFVFWLANFWDEYFIAIWGDVNVINFLYEFMIGAYLYMHRETILYKLATPKKAVALIIFYSIVWNIYTYTDIIPHVGSVHPALITWIVPFSTIVIAFSFGKKNLKIDLSYGIYIWHMIVITQVLMYFKRSFLTMVLCWVTVFVIATISWIFIEERCQKCAKKYILEKFIKNTESA